MARTTGGKGGAPARIRFVMLDAELPDGDLGKITDALQNALRAPDGATPRRFISTTMSPKASAPSNDVAADPLQDLELDGEAEAAEEPSASPRAGGPRKGKTPSVLAVDLTSEVSLADFAEAKNPSSDRKRYLVVAAWFKLHRNVEAITADHVYTCYRALKWPSNIPDFGQPLRNLKFKQFMDQKGKGAYAINHLGMAEVDDLGKA